MAGGLETAGNIDSRIQSSGLSLAFLNAFSGKAIQGIGGEVEVDLQFRGSLDQPLGSGFVRAARWQAHAHGSRRPDLFHHGGRAGWSPAG